MVLIPKNKKEVGCHSVGLKLGHTRGQSSESKYAIGSYGSQGLKVFFCMFQILCHTGAVLRVDTSVYYGYAQDYVYYGYVFYHYLYY